MRFTNIAKKITSLKWQWLGQKKQTTIAIGVKFLNRDCRSESFRSMSARECLMADMMMMMYWACIFFISQSHKYDEDIAS